MPQTKTYAPFPAAIYPFNHSLIRFILLHTKVLRAKVALSGYQFEPALVKELYRPLAAPHFIFQTSPAIGLVTGDQEDSASAIPDFLHLNLGANMVYGRYSLNKISAGFSYSWILTGDTYKTRPKSHYGRLLGEFAYIRHFRRDQMELKIVFTPILYDNGANDIQNIPIAIVIRGML